MKPVLNPKTKSKIGLILLAYIAFISLGLPDGLLGVAWPSIREHFGLPLDALGLLLFAGMCGYLTSSFFSGRLIAWLGVGGLLSASCAATGLGLLGYTLAPSWWMMVALGVLAGLGAGAIDAGLNTYVAANFSERSMQWLHASFGIGITLGPIIMTAGLNFFNNWRLGYRVVGTAQILLAVCFLLTISLWQRHDDLHKDAQNHKLTDYKTSLRETLRQPRVWLSIVMFFIYTGVEVTLGAWAYTLLTESRGVAPALAGLFAGSYWGAFTVGRIIAGLYTKRVGVHTLVRASLLAALVGTLLLLWNPSEGISLLGVATVGFAVAPIFPGMVSGTQDRVGARYAANTIGMQISASSLGATAIAGFAGVLARRISLEIIPAYLAFWIVALLVLYTVSMRKAPL